LFATLNLVPTATRDGPRHFSDFSDPSARHVSWSPLGLFRQHPCFPATKERPAGRRRRELRGNYGESEEGYFVGEGTEETAMLDARTLGASSSSSVDKVVMIIADYCSFLP
jgi:hypothetical protein